GGIAVDVEDLGPRALFRLAHLDALAPEEVDEARGGVVEVPGHDRLRRAHRHAGRLQSHLDLVRAEVALGGRLGLGIDVERVVRTALHAGLAADAAPAVEVHDAVRPAEQSGRRADLDARR